MANPLVQFYSYFSHAHSEKHAKHKRVRDHKLIRFPSVMNYYDILIYPFKLIKFRVVIKEPRIFTMYCVKFETNPISLTANYMHNY